MTIAYLNRIATAVPAHDVHDAFVRHALRALDARQGSVFTRMVDKAQIAHRFSVLEPERHPESKARGGDFYAGGGYPSTAERMRAYQQHAPELAERAVGGLCLGREPEVTHLVVTSCTGFYAPGVDMDIVERCGLDPSVERTVVGFMGCSAAMNGLKLAHHIVRSEAKARVLVVSLELCTLHLQKSHSLEQLLSFLLFADGCAAALVSAEPEGLAIDGFRSVLVPETRGLITWNIGDSGFDMFLSGKVPSEIERGLAACADEVLHGTKPEDIDLWAVHPGGRTILDAVERALSLPRTALSPSRDVLREMGNMSSATVLFVLQRTLAAAKAGQRGCAMAFGPGLVAETMRFHTEPS
jgi:predicted naringenin-chalcone synthase